MTATKPCDYQSWASFAGTGDFQINQAMAFALDHDDCRAQLMRELRKDRLRPFPSLHHPEDDPAPLYSKIAEPRHRCAWLVAGPDEVRAVLRNTADYSNLPYGEIGGRGFMLALDPLAAGAPGVDLHARQRCYGSTLLGALSGPQASPLAVEATRQAGVAGLQRDRFDLAELAEQAALRLCGLAFGFAATDHGLLQKAAATGYRALVHVNLGRHLAFEPAVLQAARDAMGALGQRAAALIQAYREVAWCPREVRGRLPEREALRRWPEGVRPPDEWGLNNFQPLLKTMALKPDDFTLQELATIAVGLIVGTVGNVQAGACLVMQQLFEKPDEPKKHDELAVARQAAFESKVDVHQGPLHDIVKKKLAARPPVAFVPRRALRDVELGGQAIKKGDDLVLWLAAATDAACPRHHSLPFGLDNAPHYCLGTNVATTLITAVVGEVLRLCSLDQALDPVTGLPKGLKQRWGFACLSYPLQHRRALRLAQQPLNVVMRVKSPVDEHAEALRRVIAVGAPRIERALRESRHVHFAWFELLDQGRYLSLHTVYDGDFDAYVQHFALTVDDLFDQLFEHIEGAPPLPVAEHPGAFVDTIRAFNAAPVVGYFFSAYPRLEAPDITRHERGPS